MIGAGFCLQWYGTIGSLDQAVAQVGVAFVVAGIIFVIAVNFFKDVMVDGTITAPDLGFSEL